MIQPRLQPLVWTVSNMEPGQSFTWIASAPGITTVAEHRLSLGADQAVTVTLGIRQSGLLAPVVGLFLSSLTKRYVNLEAQGLKQRCEATGVGARID